MYTYLDLSTGFGQEMAWLCATDNPSIVTRVMCEEVAWAGERRRCVRGSWSVRECLMWGWALNGSTGQDYCMYGKNLINCKLSRFRSLTLLIKFFTGCTKQYFKTTNQIKTDKGNTVQHSVRHTCTVDSPTFCMYSVNKPKQLGPEINKYKHTYCVCT